MSDWQEFDEWKSKLMNDGALLIELSLLSALKNFLSSKKSTLMYFKEIKWIKQSLKSLYKIKLELRKVSQDSNLKDACEHIEKAMDALKHDLHRREEEPEESEGPRRGPKSYPKKITKGIVEIIELANSDSCKRNILVEFFCPRGEFDKWLGEKSKGILQGPAKAKTIIDDYKWLSDLGSAKKKLIK